MSRLLVYHYAIGKTAMGNRIRDKKPKANAAFWRKKILGNRARDRRVNRELCVLGWRVVRVWEHELTKNNTSRLVRRLGRWFLPEA